MSTTPAASPCGATNRSGQPCARIPARGKTRCHYHGGAPGSGAQPGNPTAFKHAFYARRQRSLADDLQDAAYQPLGVVDEICLLRTTLARVADTAPPQVIGYLANT